VYIPRCFATFSGSVCVFSSSVIVLLSFCYSFPPIILYPTDFPSLFLFRSLLLIFPSHHAVSPFCLGRSNPEGNPGVRRQTTRRAASRRPGDNFWKVNRASGGAATGKSNLVSSCGFVTRECGEAEREGGCYDIAVGVGKVEQRWGETEWIAVTGDGEKCSSSVSTLRVSFSSIF